jgi:hypothetical protein
LKYFNRMNRTIRLSHAWERRNASSRPNPSRRGSTAIKSWAFPFFHCVSEGWHFPSPTRGRGEMQAWERGNASVGEGKCRRGRGEMQAWERGNAGVGEGLCLFNSGTGTRVHDQGIELKSRQAHI